MEILPAVLARDATDCKARLLHDGLRRVAPMFHVDVLDGSMFDATCFADPTVIGQWENLPDIEVHFMVHNPLPHIVAWHEHVATTKRVLIHAEVARPLGAIIERATQLGLETGLVLNPETKVERIEHHLHDLDALQLMGIHPGASGRPFLGEPILAKIRRARQLYPNLVIAVDGGVGPSTLGPLREAGATRCVASSAIWASEDPAEAYRNLVY
ncbi:hypothetical protein HYS28_03185 [Candidatus Uhrbacteria bacterium]|nr:hypothetical protein [Candidatus Uhrbacteria bacterium]